MSLFSGSASYSYAFELPPGTGGLTPALALVYSSSAGHSEVGYGWSLTLGAIERSTRFGVPDYGAGDPFELEGELLVRGPDWSGSAQRYFKRIHDGSRILYYPPPDDTWEVTDVQGMIYRYGSQPGSRLAKGPLAGGLPTGPTFRWNLDEVEDPQGNAYRIEYEPLDTYDVPAPPPGGGLETWQTWLYPRRIRYSYERVPSGISPGSQTVRLIVLNWQLRGDSCGATIASCTAIDRPTSYRSGFKVQKNWRLAEVDIGFDTNGNGVVVDPGERIRRYALTYSPKTSAADPDLPPFSRLDQIQRYGSDNLAFPRTAAAPSLPPLPTIFRYTETTRSFQPEAQAEIEVPFDYTRGDQDHLFGNAVSVEGAWDMDGDGILDGVRSSPSGSFYIDTASGEGWSWSLDSSLCDPRTLYLQEQTGEFPEEWHDRISDLVDMDGDGLPDRVVRKDFDHWCVWKNNGAGFDLSVQWTAPSLVWGLGRHNLTPYGQFDIQTIFSLLADLNGDGRPDFVAPGAVSLNQDGGFDSSVSWSWDPSSPGFVQQVGNIGQSPPLSLSYSSILDVNGDGLPDHWLSQACVGPALGIAFNLGAGFQSSGGTGQAYRENGDCWTGPTSPEVSRPIPPNPGYSETVQTVTDINGDGWVDIVYRSAQGDLFLVYFGLGDGSFLGWGGPHPNGHPGYPDGVHWHSDYGATIRESDNFGTGMDLIDVDGDGLLDHFAGNPPPDGSFALPHSGPEGLLAEVESELGGTVRFAYTPVNHVERNATGIGVFAETPDPPPLAEEVPTPNKRPFWVVAEATYDDGRAGTPDATDVFHYFEPRYDTKRREFAGMRVVDRIRVGEGALEHVLARSVFHQLPNRRGRVESESVFGFTGAIRSGIPPEEPIGSPLRTTTTTWQVGPALTLPGGGTEVPGVVMALPEMTETQTFGAATQSAITTRSFDFATGSILSETYWGADAAVPTSDDHVRAFTYLNDTDAWLVKLPTSESEGLGGPPELKFEWSYGSTEAPARPSAKITHRRAGGGEELLQESWVYDTYGNEKEYRGPGDLATVPLPSNPTRETSYDTLSTFPSWTKNALLHKTDFLFDARLGQMTKTRDPNGYLQCFNYDSHGRQVSHTERKTKSSSIGNTCNQTLAAWTYESPGNPDLQHVRRDLFSGFAYAPPLDFLLRILTSRAYFDGLGRVYLTEEPALEWNVDTFRVSRRSWNARGELACESLPDFAIGFPSCTSSASYLEHSWDALGRLVRTSRKPATVDLLTVTYDVQDLPNVPGIEVVETRRVHSSPSPDRLIQRGFDARGRVLSVSEAASGETILSRDAKGRIKTVDGPNVGGDPNLLLLEYNNLDQRTRLVPPAHAPGEPQAPAWIYQYDSNGNLSQQTSPALIAISFEYDRLNRLTKEDVPTADADVTYLYDNTSLSQGIGRLYRVLAPGVTTTYHYDLRGRVLTLMRDFGGGLLYDVDYSYDLADRVAGIYYPNGKTVWPGWDGTEQVGTELSGQGAKAVGAYHESGALQEITFGFSPGPTTTTTNGFDPDTHWLESIVTTSPVGPIQSVGYGYDEAGNVLTASGSPLTQSFGYDSLHRLTSAAAGGDSPGNYGNLVYDYDGAGNILSITANGGTPRIFQYGASGAGPHALTSVTQEGGPTRSYTYDGDGNATSAGAFALPRDDFGRVKSSATLSYTYDHTGERVRKSGGAVNKLYVTEGFEVDLAATTHEIHLFLAGRRAATASFPGNGLSTPVSAAEPSYYHADRLGSNAVVTDAAGEVIEEAFFEPFGKIVATVGADVMEYLFTDQENDDESGLMYFGARFYDPEVGRFLSQDPSLLGGGISFEAMKFDGQHLNPYSYVLNRPTAAIDENGAWAVWIGLSLNAFVQGIGESFTFGLVFGSDLDARLKVATFATTGRGNNITGVAVGIAPVVGASPTAELGELKGRGRQVGFTVPLLTAEAVLGTKNDGQTWTGAEVSFSLSPLHGFVYGAEFHDIGTVTIVETEYIVIPPPPIPPAPPPQRGELDLEVCDNDAECHPTP